VPLDLSRFETFCSRLPIRDRDSGSIVPFIFSASQRHIMTEVRAERRDDLPLRVILYKSRRTGGSTWSVALGIAHCLYKPGANFAIIAQLEKTARSIFDMAVVMTKALKKRGVKVEITKTEIRFQFSNGRESVISRATAKTVIGGRGLTLSGVLLSEASRYPGAESFVSILNAVSKDPDNIIVIETTPYGIEGQGEAFYNYWHDAVKGVNGFIPIFLPWHEDPGLCLPDSHAPDAPKGEYERWLVKEFKCTKGQLAWYRLTLSSNCAGSHDRMREENPSTAEEGFIASGRPAFDSIELAACKRDNRDPICRGTIRITEGGIPIFEETEKGEIHIWELPQPKAQYYVGADAAKGDPQAEYKVRGDFAAAVGWNGDTGNMAFRFAERVPPETLGFFLNGLGRYYNNAMINIEFTGGWGAAAAHELRDVYFYPQQYLWRGSRDDKVHAKASTAMGWETTVRSRQMLFDRFRLALRRGRCHVMDKAFLQQMSRAQMEMAWRWVVVHGHDDIFMAGLLGWICVEQYHTPKINNRISETLERPQQPAQSFALDPFTTELGVLMANANDHLKKLKGYEKRVRAGVPQNPLEGV
jgi:hypothetical protein